MNLLVPLAALFGIEVDALVERIKNNLVVNAAIGLFALIGVGFLLVALHTAMVAWVGPIWAPLIIASVALVIALAIYLSVRVAENGRKYRDADRRRSSETTAFVTTAALTALPMILKSPVARTVGLPLVALAAVALFGRSGRSSRAGDED